MFNDLPDHVAHRILYFLSTRDVARLSTVSRRCRHLCESTPFLKLDNRACRPAKGAALMSYIDRLLLLRGAGGADTQRFALRWRADHPAGPARYYERYRLISCLKAAAACGPQVITVTIFDFLGGPAFALPPGLLRCRSLQRLALRFSGNAVLKTPESFSSFHSSSSSSLKTLIIRNVKIDESFDNWVSQCCKSLKTLTLVNLRGAKSFVLNCFSLEELFVSSSSSRLLTLSVTAENLKHMELEWKFDKPEGRALRLFTPKLRSLCLRGNACAAETSLRSLSTLRIYPRPSNNGSEFACLLRLICCLHHVQRLALTDVFIKELHERGDPPILFNNLTALRVVKTVASSVDLLPALKSLLEGTPNLIFVHIGHKNQRQANNMFEREYQRRVKGLKPLENVPSLHNLKLMTFELTSQATTELALIEYFLKHAKNLMKINVLCSDELRSDFRLRISRYEKASSDVEVVFTSLRE